MTQVKAPIVGANRKFLKLPISVLVLWLLAALALPIWINYDWSAWDLRVYGKALESLHVGHDPYSDAIAIQKEHHQQLLANGVAGKDPDPPYSYVYSPITLPMLALLGRIPQGLLIFLYWMIYAAGVIGALFVAFFFAERNETRVLLYAAGVAPFFPGLLANGTLLSGNIAYILYAALLLTALLGWKHNHWLPFYVAVVAASCVKAPFLSFVLLPAFSARKQVFPAATAALAGLALFMVQPLLWPSLFKHYLEAVELQLSYNHDFGCAPAGLFSELLDSHGLPYAPWCYFFYLAYVIPLFAGLIYLSKRFLRGHFPLTHWAPVLLLGIILLNPRIQEYDVAALTLPLALILWRYARTRQHTDRWITVMLLLFVVLSAGSIYSWELRKALDGPLLVAILLAGMWGLMAIARGVRNASSNEGAQTPSDRPGRLQPEAEHAVAFAAHSIARRSA